MADNSSKTEDERILAKIVAERGVLSVKDAVNVTLQLVKIISSLHSQGKVHRKICSNTVLLDEALSATLASIEAEVTLGGIGVELVPAPMQFQNIPPISLPAEINGAKQVLTEAGILLDPRQIDFYQLGALLCFLVSRYSVSDYLRSCKAKADVPEVIRPIIDRALGMNTKDCFESGDSFASELEAIISGKSAAKDGIVDLPESIFTGAEPQAHRDTGTISKGTLPFQKLDHYEIIERIGHGGDGRCL
jgi:serine/threonine protein kinase